MAREPIRTPAPFAFEHARRRHTKRVVFVCVTLILLAILGGLWFRDEPDQLTDFGAGIMTGLIVGVLLFLADSWSELGARKIALAAMVHESRSLRGLDLGDAAPLEGLYLGDKDLRSAKLKNARCRGVVFCNSHLEEIDLRGADLREANLSGTNLTGAQLMGADLRKADLTGARADGADLSSADISEAKLNGARLRRAVLVDAKADGANLIQADLSEAKLRRTSFVNANLARARLVGAELIGTTLRGADLSYADLEEAIIIQVETGNAVLRSARIKPQTLRETSFTSVETATGAQFAADFRGAVGDVGVLGHDISFSGSIVPVDQLQSLDGPLDGSTVPRGHKGGTRFQPADELL